MTLAQLKSRLSLQRDLNEENFSDELLEAVINDGLREMAFETLLLESLDSSLTYSSSDDGFALPSDFISVRLLEWVDSQGGHFKIPAQSIARLYTMRNEWLTLNEDSASELTPLGYCIKNDYIVLDSTTQTSPYLYYYKYDTALSADANSPSFDSEYHSALIDYVNWKLFGSKPALQMWEYVLSKMKSSKRKATKGVRAAHVSF